MKYDGHDIVVKYDGEYPNLCSGNLEIEIDGQNYKFPKYCLSSGGYASFSENWEEEIGEGKWSINSYPEYFPEEFKEIVLRAINDHIEWGCCGGCL
jgi:hypothetical protein